MSTIGTVTGIIVARSGVTCMGRMLGNAGTVITQASISAITYLVTRFNADDTETATDSGTLVIATVVFDTLQTSDPRWTKDATGYNFLAALPVTGFATGGLLHQVDIKFVPVTGPAWIQPYADIPIKTYI